MPIAREFILVPVNYISEKGHDFEGNIITEDFDYSKYKIIHRKKLYDWGDKQGCNHGCEIELFSNNKFIMTAKTTEIHLLKL